MIVRSTRLICGLTSGFVLAGCYTLQPARGGVVPDPGSDVAFDISDVGRVALGPLVGPEVGQVEGRLLSKESDDYVVGVKTIRFLRGGEQVWTGEKVHLKREDVSSTYERRLSRGRSIAFAAGSAGAVVAFFATRSLLGLGQEGSGTEPPPGGSLIRP